MFKIKYIYFSLLMLTCTQAVCAQNCVGFLETKKFLFEDRNGVSPIEHFNAEYGLLKQCMSKNSICVTFKDASTNELRILSANTPEDKLIKQGKNFQALTIFAKLQNDRVGDVCVMSAYSGGTSATWIYGGVDKSGGYRLDTKKLSIVGESLSPADLLKELQRVAMQGDWVIKANAN